MLTRASSVLTVVVLMCALTATAFAITPYSQDFEGLTQSDPNALADDGWLVYGNVYSPTMTYLYGYGPYPAPNHNLAFCQIVTGEGGPDQGAQQLSVFSDYENTDHASGDIIESNVYREWTVAAADTGLFWVFDFQAKRGNIEGASTAAAFIKTLDPNNGYALTHFITADMTSIDTTWAGYSVQLYVDSSLVGQIFQIGFMNTATNYEGSGIFYDNIRFHSTKPLDSYSQDFESLTQSDPDALANDGWLSFGNVYTPAMAFLYSYGPYPAPNSSLAFSAIVTGEGGVDQGAQQLSVFSDYENADQASGNIVESIVYQERIIGAEDTGALWTFDFDAKLGNLTGASTATAFIKALDPANGYAVTHLVTKDMTSIPTTWHRYTLQIALDAAAEGQVLQFGFMNRATDYEGSGVFYDNLELQSTGATGVPGAPVFAGATLQANYPNPFSPRTRIGFSMKSSGRAELSVFDLAGRKVATLADGVFTEGEHEVSWDGRTDAGVPAAAGQYWYVLRTPTGRVARSMTLLR
jgi:hypothetical protein